MKPGLRPPTGWAARLALLAAALAGPCAAGAFLLGTAWTSEATAGLPAAFFVAIAAALIVGLGTWALALAYLRRAAELARLAERRSAEGGGARLPEVGAGAELDRLARAYNSLAARLEATLGETQRFTSDASHELRTPLTALRSAGEVALSGDDDPARLRGALGGMLEAASRMNRLIDQLLLLARSDADVVPAQIGEIDLRAALEEVRGALDVLADNGGVKLVVQAPEGLGARADGEWLRVALMNLAQNAIRHSPPGTVVTLSALPRGYDRLIEVADQGPGIAPEHHERIFERFYRVDKARARAEGGVGLGLAISKWAVERFGGRIGLRSEPGRGATFWIRVPGPAEPEAPAGSAGAGARIRPEELELREAVARPLAEVCARLGTDGRGLGWREARLRLGELGPNRVTVSAAPSIPRLVVNAAATPFNGILGILAAVSLVTGDHAATVVMALIFTVGTGLRARQERRSWSRASRAAGDERAPVAVLRRGEGAPSAAEAHPTEREFTLIDPADLVPGDLVRLSAGERAPADLRVLEARHFFVTQSALTGEAMPVQKHAATATDGRAGGLFEWPNLVPAGATVVAGEARALVVATGARAFSGALAESLGGPRGATAFDHGVNRVSWLLLRFMAVMLPVAFLLNGLLRGEWGGTFFFALAVAVGLVPELLPLVVNANLARGAAALARRRAPAKRIAALHDLGAMDLLCTDKTGTLTRDEVAVLRSLDGDGAESAHVLGLAYLNAVFHGGIRNLPDRALVAAARDSALRGTARHFTKVEELPFDPWRRRATVLLRGPERGLVAICKGAPAEVLACCEGLDRRGLVEPLDDATRARLLEQAGRLEDEGLRVLAVASRAVPGDGERAAELERGLAFAGLVAFRDPPKAGAAETLARLRGLGVEVKILTGDSPRAARALVAELGLPAGDAVLDGAEADQLDDAALAERAQASTICARLTPAQKARVVRVLRARGRVTGFLGDGVNDVPALRAADVGLASAEAAEVAREAADVVLLEKDLALVPEAVEEGRRTHGNIAKYLKAVASSNFGNALSVLGSVAFLPFLPMLPLQLLVQNLLYGATQLAIPWDRVDREYLARPRPWDVRGVGRFMLVLGPLSTVFDLAIFALLWWALGVASGAGGGAPVFQGGWFVFGLLSQTLALHVIRTSETPFWRRPASAAVLATTALATAIGAALPFSPWAGALGLEAPPPVFWAGLPLVLIAYAAAIEAVKRLYRRRTGEWI